MKINIPLEGHKVKEASIVYPKNSSTPFVFNEDNIRIYFENSKSTRFFEIEK